MAEQPNIPSGDKYNEFRSEMVANREHVTSVIKSKLKPLEEDKVNIENVKEYYNDLYQWIEKLRTMDVMHVQMKTIFQKDDNNKTKANV